MALALQAIVSLDKTGFASGLSGLSQAVSNVTGAMSMAFGGVASEIIAMSQAFGPVGGAVAALKQAVTAGASFEQQIANVSSVSGLMGEELKKVEIAARDLAKTTRFTATEAGDALYSLASAGITGADALSNTLKPALLLAGATLSSTQMATEAVTAALANFQIPANEATRIADQFAGAIATSPATMERLSEAMKYAGPAAAGFGIALEKTVAEVAAFHQVGLRGEMAGTSFRMALVQLSQESVKAGSAVGEALKGWDASTEGITGAVRRLNAAGVDTADVIQALGARAGPGIAALMKFGANAMDELAARITKTADVSKMYETQLGTLTGRFAIFKSAIEEVWLKLYGALAPALTALVENMTAAIDWVGKLSDALFAGQWQAAGDQVAALWESIKAGAAAFDWIGLFDSALASAKAAFDGIREGAGKIADAFKGIDWGKTWETLKTTAESVWKSVETFASTAMAKIGAYLKAQDWDAIWETAKTGAVKAFEFWYLDATIVTGKIAEFLRNVDGVKLWEGIRAGSAFAWGEIQNIATRIWPTILNIAQNAWSIVSDSARIAFEAIKNITGNIDWGRSFSALRVSFSDALESAYQTAAGWVTDIAVIIREIDWGEIGRMAEQAVVDARDLIIEGFELLVSSGKLEDVFKRIGQVIGAVLSGAFALIGGMFGAAISDLESGNYKVRVQGFLQSVFVGGMQAVVGLFTGLLEGLFGKNVVDNVVVGAQLMMLDIKLAIQSKIGDILEAFNQLMAGIITKTSEGAARVAEAFGLKGTAEEIREKSAKFSAAFMSGTNVMIRAAADTKAEIKLLEEYITNLNYPVQTVAEVLADMTDAENKVVVATQEAQDAADAQVSALEAQKDAVDAYVPALADMTDAENERMVAAQEAQDASDSAVNAMEAMAMKATKSVEPIKAMANAFKDIRSINVGIKIELPKITQTMLKVWATFLNAMRGLGEINVAIDVDLPVITERMLAVWGTFLKAIAAIKAEVKLSIELPKITENALNSWTKFINKIKGMSADVKVNVSLPTMTDAIAESWGKFFDIFKEGSLDLKIPNASGATGGTGGTDMASIAASLKALVAMKGVIWA